MTAGAAPTRIATRAEITRKALHLSTAIVPLGWALGWLPESRLKPGLALLAGIAIACEVLRGTIPAVRLTFERLAGPLYRSREFGAVLGATWLAVAIAVAAYAFPPRAAIAAIWAVSVGDTAAALVGRALGRGDGKSLAGSLACAIAAAIGVWWLADAAPITALVVGVAAALAERPEIGVDDNLRVTAAAGLAAWVLGVA